MDFLVRTVDYILCLPDEIFSEVLGGKCLKLINPAETFFGADENDFEASTSDSQLVRMG